MSASRIADYLHKGLAFGLVASTIYLGGFLFVTVRAAYANALARADEVRAQRALAAAASGETTDVADMLAPEVVTGDASPTMADFILQQENAPPAILDTTTGTSASQ
ncbi:hypothetical protein H696_05627 [Fonticula alba]|uniref:Uncharacterized protein n=1 Tax=Fonticula alba TaxID=691883 RepID=A0A058Z1U0_FONAL|nr:hypothetical protein H696_05627 [Fonticula alba]KCV67898.1 hypothetical protein H696_05627 [Fonticula alba]|eukprot:XP_009497718.1 hypothetical protein H696_05627 [Fonticula alba]